MSNDLDKEIERLSPANRYDALALGALKLLILEIRELQKLIKTKEKK